MFTGIISYVFKISVYENSVILYGTKEFCNLIKIGDSVAVNGVCLTVVSIDEINFTCSFHITEETISKTNLQGNYTLANIELAVKYGEHLGGHLILGHIHTTGFILSLEENGNLWISIPSFSNVSYKGSIAINGISLTIAEVKEDKIRIALIPETIKRTAPIKEGDIVNIEFDLYTEPKKDPMLIAIEEGEKGRITAPPNPWVGAVIMKNGRTISKGFHSKSGCPHAEINAIENCKEDLEGSTIYVTLEPCCLFPGKKTGSCAERIIKEKIAKVVIGIKDPNENVSGKGIEILRKAGVKVLFQEDLDINIYNQICFSLRQYIHYKKMNLPFITVKIALTVDNCYYSDCEKWITHEGSRNELYKLWDSSQAIILGPRTIEKDDPELNLSDFSGSKQRNFKFKKIIIDGSCLKNLNSKIFNHSDTYVVTSKLKKWKDVDVNLIEVSDTHNLEKVIRTINSYFLGNLMHILVEGGGILHNSFLKTRMVKEIIIFRGSKMYGENGYQWTMPHTNISLYESKIISHRNNLNQITNNTMERYLVNNFQGDMKTPLDPINVKFDNVDAAIEDFKKGKMVLVMDDEGRENEGDLIVAANSMSEDQMTEFINVTTGIICVPMEKSWAKKLNLPLMTQNNTDIHGTSFTISVDAKTTGTGVSSKDRLLTVKALSNENSTPNDFRKPGHIFPLISKNSLKNRRGHTEAAITMCKLANIYPRVAVIGELINKDGTMKRRNDCFRYARANNISIITIEDLSKKDTSPKILSQCNLKIDYSEEPWQFVCYDSGKIEMPHRVMIYGNIKNKIAPVRIHSECFTGDVLKSNHCDCGEQLDLSLKYIVKKGFGILIFPSSHEGRGIGIVEKIKAYSLQSQGDDTFMANKKLGHDIDARTYEEINNILDSLDVKKIKLLTENPNKIRELKNKIIEIHPILTVPNSKNRKYLQDKKLYFSSLEENNPYRFVKITPKIKISDINDKITNYNIAIVYSSWYSNYITRIRDKLKHYLNSNGIRNIGEYEVPGSNEIPLKAFQIAKDYDGIICVGILIKGETLHFENISISVSTGIILSQIKSETPMMNVILSCLNLKQVEERIDGNKSTLEYVVKGLLSLINV